MDRTKNIERIFEHLERNNFEAATMACLRVARLMQDHLNAAFFLRELYPNRDEVGRMILDDARTLKDEAAKFIYEHSAER